MWGRESSNQGPAWRLLVSSAKSEMEGSRDGAAEVADGAAPVSFSLNNRNGGQSLVAEKQALVLKSLVPSMPQWQRLVPN